MQRRTIADATEVMQYLTSVMRGGQVEETVVVEATGIFAAGPQSWFRIMLEEINNYTHQQYTRTAVFVCRMAALLVPTAVTG